MRGSLVVLLVVLLPGLSHAQTAPAAGSGTLTILVRDAAGRPVRGMTVTLIHDTDTDGLVVVGSTTTDPAGRVVYPDLAWGLYMVQLAGVLPDGTPIQAATLQNQVPEDDGGSLPAGGFGVRFVEPARTERLVVTQPGGVAVPLFDLAGDDSAPPAPYDPALVAPMPTPTPFRVADVAAGRLDPTGRPAAHPATAAPHDAACLIGLALVLGLAALVLIIGAVRGQRTKEDSHVGLG